MTTLVGRLNDLAARGRQIFFAQKQRKQF